MNMPRCVAPETLDILAPDDPAARHSRRDLERIHRAMGTRGMLLRAWKTLLPAPAPGVPLRILELGAGDGTLLLSVARSLAPAWPPVHLTLLDRHNLLDRATLAAYADLGWNTSVEVGDVLDWAALAAAREGPDPPWDLITTCLFLHHFDAAPLHRLLAAVAKSTRCFFACEPRRDALVLTASRLVCALGANEVTRKDAVLSVQAGFCENELLSVWPRRDAEWRCKEYTAGAFSHCFRAVRIGHP